MNFSLVFFSAASCATRSANMQKHASSENLDQRSLVYTVFFHAFPSEHLSVLCADSTPHPKHARERRAALRAERPHDLPASPPQLAS